jgi:hypothetical protein
MNDGSVSELNGLMHELSLNCSEHSLILTRAFSELKKPEFFDGINGKIQTQIQAKKVLDSGRVTQSECCAKKAAVFSAIGKH